MRTFASWLTPPAIILSLASAGCGVYTNVPAQIVVASVTPAFLNYELLRTDGTREIKITEPKVVLRGEPGSIGATFDTLTVNYYQINKAKVEAKYIPSMILGMTQRIESSNFPADPMGTGITQAQVGKEVYIGRLEYTLPIITRHVEAFGALPTQPDGAGNAGAIYAECVLSGYDDANFPISVSVYVPITFGGMPGKAS